MLDKYLTQEDIGKMFKILRKTGVPLTGDHTEVGDTLIAVELDKNNYMRFKLVGEEDKDWFISNGYTELREITDV